MELDNELKVMKTRFKDIMLKKASGILREQFQELEVLYNNSLKKLKEYKEKDERFVERVETVKYSLKTQNDKYRDAIELERVTLRN